MTRRLETEDQRRSFQPTRWSLVLDLRGRPGPGRRQDLEHLIRGYWGPVYWLIRRGRPQEEAKDLTQTFFLRLLQRGLPEGLDPERGRFRAWLVTAVKNFLLQDRRDRGRIKRGGGRLPFSLDDLTAQPPDETVPPEEEFRRRWVSAVLEQACARLEEEWRAAGCEKVYRVFEMYDLASEPRPTYGDIAARLGLKHHDVHNYLKRARARLRELTRSVVRETLADPADVEDEMGMLFGTG